MLAAIAAGFHINIAMAERWPPRSDSERALRSRNRCLAILGLSYARGPASRGAKYAREEHDLHPAVDAVVESN